MPIEPSAKGKLKASAIKPIKAGPANWPIQPKVVTAGKETELFMPGIFPAAVNKTGTTLAAPKPTSVNPKIDTNWLGTTTAKIKPMLAMREP